MRQLLLILLCLNVSGLLSAQSVATDSLPAWGISTQASVSFSGGQFALAPSYRFHRWQASIGLHQPIYLGIRPDRDFGLIVEIRRYVTASPDGKWHSYAAFQWQSTHLENEDCEDCDYREISLTEYLLHYGYAWRPLPRLEIYQSIGLGFFVESFFDDVEDEDLNFSGLNGMLRFGATYRFGK